MSNDQSPPVRKVIPYKKGGRRQSPFAEKAFQFSGTALDIAIQQREQEELEEQSPVIPADKGLSDEPLLEASSDLEAQPIQEVRATISGPLPVTPELNQELISPAIPPPQKLESVERKQPQRSARVPTGSKNKILASATVSPDLRTFITRWKPFLTDTQIGICTYVYNNSTAAGKEFCFTSTAKLMVEVSKTERQVKTVLNQLIEWKFLIKGETIINAPREKRGTHYKLNLDKS